MDPALFEQLLHEEEGPALDFKRDQYPFAKATDEERSELVKDLLGFANTWRRADAYILIGVQDVRGGRGHVVGVSGQLDDHSLQQFVNHLTNRPLRFQYEAVVVSGFQVGVIRVELQDRPFYLKRDFGKLRKGEVYVRRGSSTDPSSPATPDEIAQMGRHGIVTIQRPEIAVEFAEPDLNTRLGSGTSWEAVLLHLRSSEALPRYESYTGADPIRRALTMVGPERTNSSYYGDFMEYATFNGIFRPVRLAITNTGPTAATDVRIEFEVPHDSGIQLLDSSDAPEAPERSRFFAEIPAMEGIRTAHRSPGDVDITQFADRAHLEVDCESLQPGRTVWSEKFYVALRQSGQASLKGRVFAAALAEPKEFVLTIDAKISAREVSAAELLEIADASPT